MFKNRTLSLLFVGIIITTLLASCGSKKDVVYFQDSKDFETIVDQNIFIPKFKVDDLISVFVSTLNPEASAPFNLFRGSQTDGMRPEQVDYLVDKDGTIDFPVIGKIKVAGLSSDELRILLTEKLSGYLIDPIINIRLKNFTVTVLGQVNKPGTYYVDGEQITILEAIGLAGDLDIKGLRSNVLVIRDFNGTKVYHKIDLTTKEAMKSPVYYLTQNDVIYVEPNKSGVTSSKLDSRASILVSIASIVISASLVLITRN